MRRVIARGTRVHILPADITDEVLQAADEANHRSNEVWLWEDTEGASEASDRYLSAVDDVRDLLTIDLDLEDALKFAEELREAIRVAQAEREASE